MKSIFYIFFFSFSFFLAIDFVCIVFACVCEYTIDSALSPLVCAEQNKMSYLAAILDTFLFLRVSLFSRHEGEGERKGHRRQGRGLKDVLFLFGSIVFHRPGVSPCGSLPARAEVREQWAGKCARRKRIRTSFYDRRAMLAVVPSGSFMHPPPCFLHLYLFALMPSPLQPRKRKSELNQQDFLFCFVFLLRVAFGQHATVRAKHIGHQKRIISAHSITFVVSIKYRRYSV